MPRPNLVRDAEAPNCPLVVAIAGDFLATSTSERKDNTYTTATMSADTLQKLANTGKGESTRTLLRVVILCLIAAAAVASRLFSVIRKCPLSQPCIP